MEKSIIPSGTSSKKNAGMVISPTNDFRTYAELGKQLQMIQTCPKSFCGPSQGEGVFSVAAYFGPDAGKQKGRNPAVSEAMDGEASVAERIPRLLDAGPAKRDLVSGTLLF